MHPDATQSVANTPATACHSAEAYLERSIGLDAQTIGSAAIARAVRLRMAASGVPDEGAFLALLARDVGERGRFVDEVVVPESWFFRDPQIFAGLQQFATWFASTPGQPPLRILCVPCAAGEEPYSVAMALFEAGLSIHQFTIDAADVSHAALARATAATYSPNAFRGTDVAFRDRWFRTRGTAAELDETVRRQVHFFWGNVVDESFAANRQPYDVVFCRNLLIYLTSDARSRVERTLDRLLAPNGLLVLGAAEPPILKGPWLPVSSSTACTLRRGTPAAYAGAALQPLHRPASAARLPQGSHGQPPVDTPRPLPMPGSEAPPHAQGDRVDSRPPPSDELLHEAQSLADAGRHAEALEICRRHQQAAGPSAQLFFLMGMLYQTVGDLERAEAFLHKTLYMDPDRDDAFLSLSVVAMQRGDTVMATRYRQSAARVLARKGAS